MSLVDATARRVHSNRAYRLPAAKALNPLSQVAPTAITE